MLLSFQEACAKLIIQDDSEQSKNAYHLACGSFLLKPRGHTAGVIAQPPSIGLLGRPSLNSPQQGLLQGPFQGQGLGSRSHCVRGMALSKNPLNYLEQTCSMQETEQH